MATSFFYIYVMATSFFYIYVMATSFFYIYVMATSFFFIYVMATGFFIYIDIYITFTNWRSVQSFYWTPFFPKRCGGWGGIYYGYYEYYGVLSLLESDHSISCRWDD